MTIQSNTTLYSQKKLHSLIDLFHQYRVALDWISIVLILRFTHRLSRLKKIGVLILNLVIHRPTYHWRLSCLQKVCFRCLRISSRIMNFTDHSLIWKIPPNVMCCSKKCMLGTEVCVNGTCSVSTEKRITAFSSITSIICLRCWYCKPLYT